MIVALAGGVGGAKMAHGLAMRLPPDELVVVVNTGDDFIHLSLQISPDLDTVMYWLAGLHDQTRGWGLANESWHFMEALERLGGPAWFKLGDQDLATHVERTRRLAGGERLSSMTSDFCRRLGVDHQIVPMTDQKVRTIVHTPQGPLEFQHYFVRLRCQPPIERIVYSGAESAIPSVPFEAALLRNDIEAIVICPSNPLLSIDPILNIHGVRLRIERHRAPVVAVSPIVGGQALKGPAAKIFRELGKEASALEVARHYRGLIDGIVIDHVDANLKDSIEALGLRVKVSDIVMQSRADQARLAETVLEFAASLAEVARARS